MCATPPLEPRGDPHTSWTILANPCHPGPAAPSCVRRYPLSYRHRLRCVRGAFKGCRALLARSCVWQAPDFDSEWVKIDKYLSAAGVYALSTSAGAPIYKVEPPHFCAVLCGVVLVDESAWAQRASQWRTMRAGPRASADFVLDVRLAGTGPSAHRVDSGPNGLHALLPM